MGNCCSKTDIVWKSKNEAQRGITTGSFGLTLRIARIIETNSAVASLPELDPHTMEMSNSRNFGIIGAAKGSEDRWNNIY